MRSFSGLVVVMFNVLTGYLDWRWRERERQTDYLERRNVNETMPRLIHRFGNSFINYRNSSVESLPQHTLSSCHAADVSYQSTLADICRQAYLHNYSILSAFHLSLGPYYYYTSCALFLPRHTSLSCPLLVRPGNLSVSLGFLSVVHRTHS